MQRPTRRVFASLCAASLLASTTSHAAPPSIRNLFGGAKPIADADSLVLQQKDGPWLLLANTYVGTDSKRLAEKTALEIRQDLRMPAFIHKQSFNFTGEAGRDPSTGKTMRYANPHSYEAYAVLVGEYDSPKHKAIESDRTKLAKAQLDIFKNPEEMAKEYNTNTPAATIKTFGAHLFRSRKGRDRNPLANAFITRNPLLKDDYFKRPTVDTFVRQLNEDVDYSLLDAPGNFTVVVRTFSGCSTIEGASNHDKFAPNATRMEIMALMADKMTKALRKKGVEAYQYHDREKSIVTVGTFEQLGESLPDNGFRYAPQIRKLMTDYSALNSPYRHINPGKAGTQYAHHIADIPFDLKPKPVAIPGKR
ncbi:MAG: hypothetical protein CBB71_23485 [Rhodopirellula sp. TMED11]|nr:MAG: hypothetical protein CBB71_23485 [Rhodopirellula sp. TMED11]